MQPQGYSSNNQGHVVTLPVLNPLEIRRFIDLVYPRATAGLLNVVHVGDFTGRQFFRNDVEGITAYARELDSQGTAGIYLRATTSRGNLKPGRRGVATDSVEFPGLWADLDFGLAGHADRNELPRPPDEASAASIVALAGLPAPTLWVHSGGGIYPWWLLYEPFGVVPETQNYLTTLSRKWHAVLAAAARTRGWFYGTEASDLARVLRLPGSVNRKVAGRDRPCYIVSDVGPRYLLQDLHHAGEAATQRWAVHVSTAVSGPRAGDQATAQFLTTLKDPDGPPCRFMTSVRDRWLAAIRAAGPSCHDEGLKASTAIAEESVNEHRGAVTAMGQVRDAWLAIRQPGATTGRAMESADTEWDRLEQGAWAKAAAHATVGGDAFFTDQKKCRCSDGANNPLVVGASGTNLPSEFWSQRPYFRDIRSAAHSRGHSADLVLLADLARISAMVDPKLQVDTGLGPDSLNLGILAIGDPSAGKSSGTQMACELTPRAPYLMDESVLVSDEPANFYDMLPIGSGEGVPEAYYGNIRKEVYNPETGKSRWETVRKQVRRNVFFYVDEGEGFLKTSTRSGSTVLAVLRTGLFGGGLGQQNGKAETTRLVFKDQYSMGVVIGFQLDSVQPVLKEATLGTPQRFLWVSADDPHRPEEPTEHPGLLPINIATPMGEPLTGVITAPPEIRLLVWRRRLRLDGPVPTLDGHAYRLQAKVAGLLAIRDGRMHLTMEDWELAGVIWATSCAVRDLVIEHGKGLAEQEAQARDEAAARRAVVVKTAETAGPKAVERVARLVAKWVHAEPGITRKALNRCCAGRDKKYLMAAVEHALDHDWVTGSTEDGSKFFPGTQIP